MNPPEDNRAVSALFRVFGAVEALPSADAREIPDRRGMHRGEHAVFCALIPLTVLVAVAVPLTQYLGNLAGGLIAAPAALVAIHVLPFILGGKRVLVQWRLWLAAMLIWAIWRRESSGITGLFSHAWIGIGVMNLAAGCVLAWQASMRWSGVAGLVWRAGLFLGAHVVAVAVGFRFGWYWGVAVGGVVATFFCKAVLDPRSRILGEIVDTTGSREILITIDDGPDPRDTPVLLDLLDRHGAKAVFFMIGRKVADHPELAREVIRRGHEIGNHTLTHPQASFWCAGPWRTYREIRGCQEIITEVTGQAPTWFRAPVGHRNGFTHPVARSLGLRVMAWNRRGYDAVEKDAGKVLGRILPHLGAGDIVLIHEATPIAAAVLSEILRKSHPVAEDLEN